MWHILVAFAATCATGFTPTPPWWASRTVDHKNGVKDDNREANVQILTRSAHARLEAQRASEAGSDRWKKAGDTQGAPCEYNKGDGEGWVRAASRSEAGRLTGVDRRRIAGGLNKVESGEIWRASVGIEFRDVSVIEGKRGESWARAPAPYAAVEVSTEGRVRDCETERARLGTKAGRYVVHRIGEERIYEHDLVLLTWKGLAPPDKPAVLHDPAHPTSNALRHLRYGSHAENNAAGERRTPTELAGDALQYRTAAVGGRRAKPGPWVDATSRRDAARKTGMSRRDVEGALLEDGEPRVGVSEPVRGARGVLYEFQDLAHPADIDDFEDLYLHESFFALTPDACNVNAFLGRTFADIQEKGKPRFIVYNVRVDANGLIIEFYSADLPGVPRALKDRHWCHYEANKHWIEWVDDGLSERADVGSKKARAALPASLR